MSLLCGPRVTPQPVARSSAVLSAATVATIRLPLRLVPCRVRGRIMGLLLCSSGRSGRGTAPDDGGDCVWCSSRLRKQWRFWNLWSRLRLWPATLAGQFLVLQLTVLLLVVAVASVVSVQQSDADFRETRGARLRTDAESLANNKIVRLSFRTDAVGANRASLASATQRFR